VAVARNVVLSWQLLTKQEDYAFKRSALVEKKLRAIELRAGAPRRRSRRQDRSSTRERTQQERELSLQSKRAYIRLVSDWKASRPAKQGAGAAPGRASQKASNGKAARQAQAPKPALSLAVNPDAPKHPTKPQPVKTK
jgi:hypothetical protein